MEEVSSTSSEREKHTKKKKKKNKKKRKGKSKPVLRWAPLIPVRPDINLSPKPTFY